ncbi:MAG: class I SAM-dependent methyltransferase [candidate division SR1 bacterium]|nr:class I SAM-dependent methyltransferase [candidate division SR1 bacterium]
MNCIACASNKVDPLFSLKENSAYTVYGCHDCGLEFLYPQPDLKTLDMIYNGDYYGSRGIKDNYENVKRMKQATFSWIIDKIKKYKKEGKLLDIGCATGFFMDIAEKKGFDVYGVDISKEAVKKAQSLFGEHKVFNSSIDDFNIKDKFDVIIMTDLLEHVFDPSKTLHQVKSFLNPGGILVVLSPDAGSFSRKLMKKYRMQFKLEHLYYFTDKSILSLSQNNGYNLIYNCVGIKKINFAYLFGQSKVYKLPIISYLIKFINFILPKSLKNHNFTMKFGEKLWILQKPF